MLILVLLWLLLYLLFSVLGAGIIHAWQRYDSPPVSQVETLLTGLICVVGVLQVASLFLPVTFWFVVGLTVLAVGLNGWLANRPLQAALATLYSTGRQPICWLLVLVVLLYAVQRTTNIDTATYHLPAVRYAERFAAIPGLGNLFSRLAFNSSFFVAGAAFGFTELAGQTLFPLNSFLLLVFGGYVIRQFRRPVQQPVFGGLLFSTLSLALFFLIRQVSSLTPDVWATLLSLFVFLLWLNGSEPASRFRPFLLVVLLFTCLTVKLATLPLLFVFPCLAYQHRHWLRWQHGLWVLALGCLLLGPWLARSVILSGYMLFPLTEPDLFSVDWKIPKNVGQYEQNVITHWARFHLFEPTFDPQRLTWSFGRWVSWWWTHWWFWYNWPNRPTFILAVLSPVLVATQWLLPTLRDRLRGSLPVYAVALTGFLFWFLKAPEFRFGYAFIWTAALLPVFTLLRLPLPSRLTTGILGLVLAGLLIYFVAERIDGNPPLRISNLVLPHRLSRFDPEAQHTRYKPYVTRSGLTVLVPYQGVCLDNEQPCTPFFFDDIELRGLHVSDGFRRNQTHADSVANAVIKLQQR